MQTSSARHHLLPMVEQGTASPLFGQPRPALHLLRAHYSKSDVSSSESRTSIWVSGVPTPMSHSCTSSEYSSPSDSHCRGLLLGSSSWPPTFASSASRFFAASVAAAAMSASFRCLFAASTSLAWRIFQLARSCCSCSSEQSRPSKVSDKGEAGPFSSVFSLLLPSSLANS